MKKAAYYVLLLSIGVSVALLAFDFTTILCYGMRNPAPPLAPDPILCMALGIAAACAIFTEGEKP
jgi:hypothetical protein